MKAKHVLFTPLLSGLLALVLTTPVQAVLLDDEPAPPPKTVAKPAAKPKPRQKSGAEQEVERLKRELAKEKARHHQSASDKSPATANSGPRIEMVKLPTGIAIGKYEVTQGQWRAVMGTNPSSFTNCGDNCPVERVSWEDVQQFIQRLNSQTGKRFRLPSEDEWVAACQAGSYGSEYCGSYSIDAVAWYADNSGDTTHTVGQKQANAWGLYDMSGNVWEWTNSCFLGLFQEKNDCSQRVYRGGSWSETPAFVRSAYRFRGTPSHRFSALGFRLAQDL